MDGAMGTPRDVQAQINITPLVDVMLVLLVIFMVTAPALVAQVDTRLPQPSPDVGVAAERIRLEVDAGGQWLVDGVPLSQAEAADRLSAQARRAPRTVVEVRAAADADYQRFLDALALARNSGARDITTAP